MKLIKGDRLPDAKVFIFDNDPKEVSIKEIIGEDKHQLVLQSIYQDS